MTSIIGLYAAGIIDRDIRAHLEEVYGLKVSADLVSASTDARSGGQYQTGRNRLWSRCIIVFLDALRVQNPRCGKPSGQNQSRLP